MEATLLDIGESKVMKKIIILCFFIFIIFVLILVLLRGYPPGYLQSVFRFHFLKNDLNSLANNLSESEDIFYVSLSRYGGVEINKGNIDKPIEEVRESFFLENLSRLSVDPVWKTDSGVMFYIGSEEDNEYIYQLSYVKLIDKRLYESNVGRCSLVLGLQGQGSCRYRLDKYWSLQYDWVGG